MSRLRRDGTGVSIATLPGAGTLEAALLRVRWQQRSLAAPPTGSALRGVPGDRGLPVLGHSLEVLIGGPEYGRRRYERYGPVSWLDAFILPLTSTTEYARSIFPPAAVARSRPLASLAYC